MQILANTVPGVYDSSTGVISAREPMSETSVFRTITDVATTTQRVEFANGITPKAVMFVVSAAWDFNPYNNGKICAGWSTGGSAQCCAGHMIDTELASPAQIKSSHSDITCIRTKQTEPNTTPDVAFNNVVFGAGYVEFDLTVNTTGGESHYGAVSAFGGDAFEELVVWTKDDLGNSATTVDVDGLGSFIPDGTFITSVGFSTPFATYDDTTVAAEVGGEWMFGMALNDGSDTQGCIGIDLTHNTNPVDTTTIIRNNRCLSRLNSGAETWNATAGSWLSGQFSLTLNAGASNAICMGLAFKLADGYTAKMSQVDIPTNGDISVSDQGIYAAFDMLLSMAGPTAYNTVTQTASMGESIAVFSDAMMGSNSRSLVYGQNSWDEATQTAFDNNLEIWEGDAVSGQAANLIVVSDGYTVTQDGVEISLPTNHASVIKSLLFGIGS